MVRDGERVSTLDLFGRGWVLLAEDERWGPAAAWVGAALSIPVECVRIGVDAVVLGGPGAFRAAFGLEPGGASLVCPDGYVAWRSTGMPTDPTCALTDALDRVSSAKTLVERL